GRHLQHSSAGACEEVARAQSGEYREDQAQRDRRRERRLHDADRRGHDDPGRPFRRVDRLGDRRPRSRSAREGGCAAPAQPAMATASQWRCGAESRVELNHREAMMAKRAKKAKSKSKKAKKAKKAAAKRKQKRVVAKRSAKKARRSAPKKAPAPK